MSDSFPNNEENPSKYTQLKQGLLWLCEHDIKTVGIVPLVDGTNRSKFKYSKHPEFILYRDSTKEEVKRVRPLWDNATGFYIPYGKKYLRLTDEGAYIPFPIDLDDVVSKSSIGEGVHKGKPLEQLKEEFRDAKARIESLNIPCKVASPSGNGMHYYPMVTVKTFKALVNGKIGFGDCVDVVGNRLRGIKGPGSFKGTDGVYKDVSTGPMELVSLGKLKGISVKTDDIIQDYDISPGEIISESKRHDRLTKYVAYLARDVVRKLLDINDVPELIKQVRSQCDNPKNDLDSYDMIYKNFQDALSSYEESLGPAIIIEEEFVNEHILVNSRKGWFRSNQISCKDETQGLIDPRVKYGLETVRTNTKGSEVMCTVYDKVIKENRHHEVGKVIYNPLRPTGFIYQLVNDMTVENYNGYSRPKYRLPDKANYEEVKILDDFFVALYGNQLWENKRRRWWVQYFFNGSKPTYATWLIGEPGVGKSSTLRYEQYLHGIDNVEEIDLSEAGSSRKFIARICQATFLVLEESSEKLTTSAKNVALQSLKKYIANDYIAVEEKNQKKVRLPTYFDMLILANEVGDFPLGAKESRRVSFHKCKLDEPIKDKVNGPKRILEIEKYHNLMNKIDVNVHKPLINQSVDVRGHMMRSIIDEFGLPRCVCTKNNLDDPDCSCKGGIAAIDTEYFHHINCIYDNGELAATTYGSTGGAISKNIADRIKNKDIGWDHMIYSRSSIIAQVMRDNKFMSSNNASTIASELVTNMIMMEVKNPTTKGAWKLSLHA